LRAQDAKYTAASCSRFNTHSESDEIRRVSPRLSDVAHGTAGELASGCAPRGDVQAFQDRTAVPVERAIGIQEPDFCLDTERSRNVLNSGLRDLFDWQESTDRLKDLQVHKQRHLG
jgi:hypothetical protein